MLVNEGSIEVMLAAAIFTKPQWEFGCIGILVYGELAARRTETKVTRSESSSVYSVALLATQRIVNNNRVDIGIINGALQERGEDNPSNA